MGCPRKNKNCKPSLIYLCKNKNFICSGIAKKGSKISKDIVWLCIRGELAHSEIELTPHEASLITSTLASSVGMTLPQILKKIK
jgi:hypothetical protein